MTSHFINYFVRRLEAYKLRNPQLVDPTKPLESNSIEEVENIMFQMHKYDGKPEENCTFCEIVSRKQSAIIVFENEYIIAFFDILPIRTGHILVVPKLHYQRLSHLPDLIGAKMGEILPKLSRALCIATNQPDFNVVSNQGFAQIVHHLHFHLVPAPTLNSPKSSSNGWASIIGREELDEEEAELLAIEIRAEMVKQNSLKLSKL